MPSFLATSPTELPLSWFSLDTIVSAGWETIAQNTPAVTHRQQLINCVVDVFQLYFWSFEAGIY